MSSKLTNNSLIINGTQEITGVSTTLSENDKEVITGKAFIDFLKEKEILIPVLDQFTVTLSGATTLTFVD